MESDQDQITITRSVRIRVFDRLGEERISWHGVLTPPDFLERLYDLGQLGSTDRRYTTARADIVQHTVHNPMDWGIDWVLYDSRFRLLGGSDATFLQFLEEMLSPRVQATLENQRRAAVVINECLQEDGWQLVEQRSDSSRPHFKALRADLQSSSGIHELERDLVDQLQDLEASSPDNTILPRIQREIARILSGLRDGDAELVVGTAKELVESAAMWRLHALGNIETQGLDFQQRVSRAIQHMQYGEASVNQSASRIKSGLSQITTGLRDLRNHHGTGHGRHGGPSDIPADVLGLAVRCAIAVGIWLYTAPLPISEDA